MGIRPDGTDTPPRIDYKAGPGKGGTLTEAGEGEQEDVASSLLYGTLQRKHSTYDALYWAKCKALYAGGRALFRNKALLNEVFPMHRNEPDDIYHERLKRAFYIDYPGEIIDYIVSGLATDPIECMAETEHDSWYDDFFEDVSEPGGRKCTLNRFLRTQILTALQCRTAWAQVDFPAVEAGAETEAEQEAAGALNAYAFPLNNEQVFDWEEDSAGGLIWAKICTVTNRRESVASRTDVIRKEYTVYNRIGWARYIVQYRIGKEPKPEVPIPLDAVGVHSFGVVPLLRLELPDGLWAMSKLEGMAVEYLNKRCALSWAEYKSLFQERHEFMAPPDPLAGAPSIADDQGRATDQIHGIGWNQIRYAGDRVEFIGPDSAPFSHALASCEQIRNEMHRVTYQMALATDTGSAALAQSGDSKRENRQAHGVVLVGLGEFVREHAQDVVQAVSAGRGDNLEWTASGMSKFETSNLSVEIADAEKLEGIDIPSPTFQRRHKYALAKSKLGDEASEEDLAAIEAELEEAYSMEAVEMERQEPGMDMEVVQLEDDEDTPPAMPPRPSGYTSNPKPTNGA